MEIQEAGPWKRIWRLKVPEKIRFFLWLVFKGELPRNEKRNRNQLRATAACPRCDEEIEDLEHLFIGCPQA